MQMYKVFPKHTYVRVTYKFPTHYIYTQITNITLTFNRLLFKKHDYFSNEF